MSSKHGLSFVLFDFLETFYECVTVKIRHSGSLRCAPMCSAHFGLSARTCQGGLCDKCTKEEMPDMKTNNGLAESRAQEIPPLKVIAMVLPRSRSREGGGKGGWWVSAVSSPLQSMCLTVHRPHNTRAAAPLSAHLSHLITLSLSASLCSYPWQPASNNGESSGPSMGGERCRGEGKSAGDGETEEDGKKKKAGRRARELSRCLRRSQTRGSERGNGARG